MGSMTRLRLVQAKAAVREIEDQLRREMAVIVSVAVVKDKNGKNKTITHVYGPYEDRDKANSVRRRWEARDRQLQRLGRLPKNVVTASKFSVHNILEVED